MNFYLSKTLSLYFLFFVQFSIWADSDERSSSKAQDEKAVKPERTKKEKPKVDLFDPPEFKKSETKKKTLDKKKTESEILLKAEDLPEISLKAKVIKADNSGLAYLLVDNEEVMVEPNDILPLVINKSKWELKIISITKNGVEIEINYNSMKLLVK